MDIILFSLLGGLAGALLGGLVGLLFSKRRCPQCNIRFPRFGGGTKRLAGGNRMCLNCACQIDMFGKKLKAQSGRKAGNAIGKRLAFGAIWCVVLYYAATIGTATMAGAIAGYRDPANASKAGAAAGTRAVAASQGYILIGSLLISTIGAVAGWLPGTRVQRSSEEPPQRPRSPTGALN
jgi:hypothetical protein